MSQFSIGARWASAVKAYSVPPSWFWLGAGLFALLGLVLSLLVTTTHGVGLSPDSVSYLAAARNMAAGEGFRSFNSQPVTLWPPLYPALLAALQELTQVDALVAARWLHAGLFVATIALTTALAVRAVAGEWIVALAIVGVAALSPVIWPYSAMLLTEGLFACLVLMLLLTVVRDEVGWGAVALGGVLAAALGMTRYIGIAFAFAGALALIFAARGPGRVFKASLFAAIAAAPWILWLGRNARFYGLATGPRYPSAYGVGQNLAFTLDSLLQMLLGGALARPLIAAALLLPLAIAAAAVLWRFPAAPRPDVRRLRVSALLFSGSYLILLVATSTLAAYDRISVRLVMPVYIPVLLILGSIAADVLRNLRAVSSGRLLSLLTAGAVMAVVGLAAARGVDEIFDMRATGLGYRSEVWVDSPTLALAIANQSLLANARVFSNDPPALFLLANVVAEETPRHTAHNSPAVLMSPEALDEGWPPTDGIVVWFAVRDTNPDFYSLNDLFGAAAMNPLAETADGGIYQVVAEPLRR